MNRDWLLKFFTLSKNVVKTWRLGGQLHERKSLKGKASPQCLVPVCKKVHHSPPVFESTSTPPSTSITILLFWDNFALSVVALMDSRVNQYSISWIVEERFFINTYCCLQFIIDPMHSTESCQINIMGNSKAKIYIVFRGMVWHGILYP